MNLDLQTDPSNILVVDDEKAVRFTYGLALSNAGYTVFYAENGEEALKLLGNDNINVIFLDLNLPDMSGLELCAQVRCVWPNAYIIAITGYAAHFDITGCYNAGFDDYLEKPIGSNLLQTSVIKAFKQIKKMKQSNKL